MPLLKKSCRIILISLLALAADCSEVTGESPVAQTIPITDAAALKTALGNLTDGATLQLAAGDYPGNWAVKHVQRLSIEAADASSPPHFKGGGYAWHFSSCEGLTLRNLRISGQTGNGINLDDGGQADRPTLNVTLEGLQISDIGPRGNTDGIKCSGLDELTIRNCSVNGWGGQAIDLVGCHRVLVTGCKITGKSGFAQDSGVQCKGGSEQITIEKCEFVSAGQRPINAGGSTGAPYFRPLGAKFEARDVSIRDNVIKGSPCACAFVGVDGASFTGNQILFPEKWIFRILQETNEAGFVASRNVLISDNSIAFRRAQVSVEVNVGANTQPETFQFSKNRWFAEDRPDRSKPRLPTEETDGVYGIDWRQ